MKRIKVMIVEDSPTVRELLKHMIAGDERFEIVAVAESGERALLLLETTTPDVITMDIRLPGINGFEATQKIMQIKPTPIVVVSASVTSEDLNISMNALRAGALSVIEKPLAITHQAFDDIHRRLLDQLMIMSEVKVVRQRMPRNLDIPRSKTDDEAPEIDQCYLRSYRMLGLVASTGGPHALVQILSHLPNNFSLPIALVQHITPSFLEGFVSWLNSLLHFEVVMVHTQTIPSPGYVYLAPPDCHLILKNGFLMPHNGPSLNHQRPSGTLLFSSMAECYKDQCMGVILTGMGEDGAKGLLDIKKVGGFTIAEDESTAVVHGMPGAAIRMGATCNTLKLDEIARTIRNLVQ